MPRGGKREGAGRLPSGKTRLVIHVTAEERAAIKKLIDEMRTTQKNTLSSR